MSDTSGNELPKLPASGQPSGDVEGGSALSTEKEASTQQKRPSITMFPSAKVPRSPRLPAGAGGHETETMSKAAASSSSSALKEAILRHPKAVGAAGTLLKKMSGTSSSLLAKPVSTVDTSWLPSGVPDEESNQVAEKV